MKIIKSLKQSGLFTKGISKAIKNEKNKQKGALLPMLLGTLAASILGNTLIGKRVIRAGEGKIRAGGNVYVVPLFN